ncbi:GspE/PulE family protein, partial [Patescibacteria group bacterium]|nr:GspE/PulE family protein [Patescibacteria group bacterium]
MKLQKQKYLEDILYDKKLLTEDQVSAIKLESLNTGKNSEEIINERKYVTSKDLAQAKGILYDVPFYDLKEQAIRPEILELVPENTAKTYRLIPFDKKNNFLYLAMADPLDLQIVEFIERKAKLSVKTFIADSAAILKVTEEQYGKSIGEDVFEALEEFAGTQKIEESISDIKKAGEVIRDAPVARVVNTILEYAVKARASDVHIEPQEEKTRVRYRIDGVLQERLSLPKKVTESVMARIKILAGLKIDEKRKPQDGRFKVEIGDTTTDLRVSSLPTVFGEKIVIRLLKEQGQVLTFKDLGLRGIALKHFEEVLLRPNGIILVTGPTGSGKTVTLATALSKLNTVRVNIITLEDPVEIRVHGVNQVQINTAAGLSFASGLRSILRQDPNIIMVGEIRDSETASLAINAALTGHLVLSTLHTNSAAGAIPRLIDMGAENFLLASTLNLVLAQRLVRKICSFCKEKYEAPKEVAEDIKKGLGALFSAESADKADVKTDKTGKVYLYRGKGCDKCSQQGYLGRVGIFEVMTVSSKIAKLILERRPES